jgi:hypothetical protein
MVSLAAGGDTVNRLSGAKMRDRASQLEGYRRMAADAAQEQEALEWCEALCGDALGAEEGEASKHAEEQISHGKKLSQ